uniref:Elongation of fatty acids protein n=1 Tax=Paramoeba aestuarina TaxID=180227 RepID=A0A7S4L885_9EUKA
MSVLDTWFFTTFVSSPEHFYGRFGPVWCHIIPWASVTLYYLSLSLLPQYLGKGHKGFRKEIKWLAVFWNLGLSIISGLILVGIGIPYWEQVKQDGWWNVFCDPPANLQRGVRPSIFWGHVFAVSKYVELFDTIILILKDPGRKLLFLHWYHHITVLIFTWYGELYFLSVGYQYVMANAFVHLLMYFYYFLAELGVKPGLPWQIGMTSIQILQMVYGIGCSAIWVKMYLDGWNCSCDRPHLVIIGGSLIYISYFYLFLTMFFERYVWGKKKTPSSSSSSSGGRKGKPKDQ